MAGTAGTPLGGADTDAVRPVAVPEPHRGGDPRLPAARPSRRKRAKRLDRFSQLAVTSARLALTDAELAAGREDPDRIGAMMGSALGGVAFAEQQVPKFLAEGPRGLDASLALAVFPGAASCNIAIEFGFTGPNATNAMSCASGTIAVGEAFHVVRDGRADVMLAGGAEAPLAPLTFAAFSNIRAMRTRNDDPGTASRPFDAGRDGFVMGEGAAVLALGERQPAVAPGAEGGAAIVGPAHNNDAYHTTPPRPAGGPAGPASSLGPEGRPARPEVVVTNSFGFGGINATLVLRRA